MTTTIIYRQADLSVTYGVHLLNEYVEGQYKAYPTENITVPDEKMKTLKGSILIVGHFYKDLNLFNAEAKITVFLNNADVVEKDDLKHIKFIRADKDVGFLTSYVLPKLKETETKVDSLPVSLLNFCDYLDEYMYGQPSETTLCFKNGIYTYDGKTLLEKVQNAHREPSLMDIIYKGKDLYNQNKHIAEKRYNEGKYINIEYKGKEYKGYVSYGDTAIIETLLHILKKTQVERRNEERANWTNELCERSPQVERRNEELCERSPQVDIAILLRYNFRENKTFISLRTSNKLIAGHVAHELYKGGGSEYMAGASVNGNLIL